MKKFTFILTMICSILILDLTAYAKSNTNEVVYTQPDSVSYDGVLPDGSPVNLPINNLTNKNSIITPQFLVYVEYVSGAYLANRSIVHELAYIYGTSVSFVKGANPSYQLQVTRSTTKSHQINVSYSAKFDIKVVENEIKGGYQFTNTATVTRGETYACSFTDPGLYDLSWYMRGHRYNIFGQCRYVTTDTDNGQIKEAYLGSVVFPTNEVHFDIRKGY